MCSIGGMGAVKAAVRLEAISKMYLACDGTVLTQYKVLTTNELKLK